MEILTKEKFEEFSSKILKEITEIKGVIESKKERKIFKNKDLVEYLGVSYSTLEKMRNSNILPYKKVMGNYYYLKDDIDKLF